MENGAEISTEIGAEVGAEISAETHVDTGIDLSLDDGSDLEELIDHVVEDIISDGDGDGVEIGAATVTTATSTATTGAANTTTATTGAANTTTVAATKVPKKTEICEGIFRKMVAAGNTRQEILAAFKAEAGMTPDGASTYYANLSKKTGLSGAKSVRAKATPATTGAVAADTQSNVKQPAKQPAKKKGGTTTVAGAQASFATVRIANGVVSDVQPTFSQLTATRVASQDNTLIAVIGVPTVGDAESSLTRIEPASA